MHFSQESLAQARAQEPWGPDRPKLQEMKERGCSGNLAVAILLAPKGTKQGGECPIAQDFHPLWISCHLWKSCAMFYPYSGTQEPSSAALAGLEPSGYGPRVWRKMQGEADPSQDQGLSGAESSDFSLISNSFLQQDSPASLGQNPPPHLPQARSHISHFLYTLGALCRSHEVQHPGQEPYNPFSLHAGCPAAGPMRLTATKG